MSPESCHSNPLSQVLCPPGQKEMPFSPDTDGGALSPAPTSHSLSWVPRMLSIGTMAELRPGRGLFAPSHRCGWVVSGVGGQWGGGSRSCPQNVASDSFVLNDTRGQALGPASPRPLSSARVPAGSSAPPSGSLPSVRWLYSASTVRGAGPGRDLTPRCTVSPDDADSLGECAPRCTALSRLTMPSVGPSGARTRFQKDLSFREVAFPVGAAWEPHGLNVLTAGRRGRCRQTRRDLRTRSEDHTDAP